MHDKWLIGYVTILIGVGIPVNRFIDMMIGIALHEPMERHASTFAVIGIASYFATERWGNAVIVALEGLDAWLHSRFTNPMFDQIQRWLHVNRFDLFRWGLVVSVGLAAMLVIRSSYLFLVTGKFIEILTVVAVPMYVADIVMYGFRRIWDDLLEASERYENGQFTRAEPELMTFCQRRVTTRLVWLVFVIVGVEWELMPLYPGISSESDFFWITHLICLWLIGHLYDANDIHPRDRTYLLSPQDQEAS